MRNLYLFIFISLGILTSCHKEPIEEPIPNEQAVFTAQGTIGSEAFSIKAGENNFYMSTFSESFNGVQLNSGKLSDGNFELEMGIFNGNIDLPSSSSSAQDLPENISFAILPTQPLAILSKDLLPNSLFIQEIKWFIDGVYAGTNDVEIMVPGKHNVCAVVTFFDGSSSSLCNEMILGYVKHATCSVRHFLGQNGNLQAWVDEDQVPVTSVKWFMDGTEISNDLKLNVSVNDQSHTVKAEIIFENGVKRTKSILIDGSLSGKFIDDFSVFENNSNTTNWDFNARISLKKEGKVYQSSIAQNQSSTIHITDVSYFGTNSAGKMVFKVTAEISCLLKDVASNETLPFNCVTVFGLEIN